jgi:hypothetical protein
MLQPINRFMCKKIKKLYKIEMSFQGKTKYVNKMTIGACPTFQCHYGNVFKKGIDVPTYGNVSKNIRVSGTLKNSLGGRTVYGLNNEINYLGRIQGQLGGSEMPIRNQF